MISRLAGRGRELLHAASQAHERRGRVPPRLAVDPAPRRAPTVFYLAPDLTIPSGGTRVIYRHVDALTSAGIDAVVLHSRRGFRCDWFPHSTPVKAAAEVTVGPQDILVVPEYNAIGFDQLPAGTRKIIFNQGAYHTFDHVPYERTGPGEPYRNLPGLTAILTVSADSARLLRCAFPELPVEVARPVVDPRFQPPSTPAGRRIAYMPRRRHHDRQQLLHILRSRGSLAGWELVPIDGRGEQETAELMRGCAIFLSFSEREGFGLPPAEAMASGCYVVGFPGMGGAEYFDPGYCSPVPESDLYAYVMAVEEAIRRYERDPGELAGAGRAAAARIRGHYHPSGLRDDLVGIYRGLLTPGRPEPAADPVE